MVIKIKPSKAIWDWYSKDITRELVTCLIADKIGGYWISHSGYELLKDLDFLTKKGNVNKKGKKALAAQLHDKYHHNKNGIIIIEPR